MPRAFGSHRTCRNGKRLGGIRFVCTSSACPHCGSNPVPLRRFASRSRNGLRGDQSRSPRSRLL